MLLYTTWRSLGSRVYCLPHFGFFSGHERRIHLSSVPFDFFFCEFERGREGFFLKVTKY